MYNPQRVLSLSECYITEACVNANTPAWTLRKIQRLHHSFFYGAQFLPWGAVGTHVAPHILRHSTPCMSVPVPEQIIQNNSLEWCLYTSENCLTHCFFQKERSVPENRYCQSHFSVVPSPLRSPEGWNKGKGFSTRTTVSILT